MLPLKQTYLCFRLQVSHHIRSISFLTLSDKDSKLSKIDFTLFIRQMRYWGKWWSAEGSAMYLQFPNCKNIEDSCSLENYVETYAH